MTKQILAIMGTILILISLIVGFIAFRGPNDATKKKLMIGSGLSALVGFILIMASILKK